MSKQRLYYGTVLHTGQKKLERIGYEVWLDPREVEQLAHKAARNRSQKSRLGPLEVYVTARSPLEGDA